MTSTSPTNRATQTTQKSKSKNKDMSIIPKNTGSFIESLKGKKPLAIAIAVVIFAVGAYAIHKGYITEALFNEVINQVDAATANKAQVVDSVKTVVDSVAN